MQKSKVPVTPSFKKDSITVHHYIKVTLMAASAQEKEELGIW